MALLTQSFFMPHFVYILQSLKDGKYYIGETSNVEARLHFHNAGLQRSTKHRRPFKIVLIEAYPDRILALKREKEIKSWKGGIQFKKLIEGSSPASRDTTFGT
jgi:putative endonuclease